MVLLDAKADASDLAGVAAHRDGQPEFVAIFRELEKSFCVLFGVRVRDAQSGRGDFARADQRQQFGDVCLGVRTKTEAWRFEGWVGTHHQSARATAIPASAPPR